VRDDGEVAELQHPGWIAAATAAAVRLAAEADAEVDEILEHVEAPTIDQVVADSRLPVPQVLSTISVLEMRHLLRRLGGNLVARP